MGTLLTKKSPMIDSSPPSDTNQFNFIPDPQPSPPRYVTPPPPPAPPIVEYPSTMMSYQKYKCDQCGMVFPSNESLFKHKTRFCIGVKDSGIGRQPVYSDDEDLENQTRRSTVRKVVRHYSPPPPPPVDKVCFICFITSIVVIYSSDLLRKEKKSMIGNDNVQCGKLSKIWKIEFLPILFVRKNSTMKVKNTIIFTMKYFLK